MRLVPIDKDGHIETTADDPSATLAGVIEQTARLYDRRGFVDPWIGYVAVEGSTAIGTCGFAGPPNDSEVEIAYFTFPGHEGRGVATAMARLLIERTLSTAASEGLTYIAHTLPQDGPSTTVLRRIGFEFAGLVQHPEDGPVWKWRRMDRV